MATLDGNESTDQSLDTRTDGPDNELPTLAIDERDNITFRWAGYGLLVDAEHFNSDGQAELTFWHDTPDHKQLLLQKRAKLLSSSNTGPLIKELRDANDGLQYLPWNWILTCIGYKVLKTARQGEPVQDIWPTEDDDLVPAYLLEPILYLNHPTVIFGDYGSFKSTLGLVIGYMAQLPHVDNKLGLVTLKESTHCLYLDYEDDPSSLRKRWGGIQRGFGIEAPMPIPHRHMTNTLADSIDSLQQIKKEKDIKLLIVDSLGPAARGNLNDPEPAIKYHEALRKLGITSLTLAHCSKDQFTKRRSIFGSVFFTNLARSVWECKAEQESGETEAVISLSHRKANLSKLHPTLGYRFTFTDSSIMIAKADLRDTGLSGELPLSVRISDLLRRGAMPVKDIAEALDANAGSVKSAVNRLAKKGITVKIGESWGLKQEA
jgi:hypothetical protein